MADTNRYRRHTINTKLRFYSVEENEVKQLFVGNTALSLDKIKNDYGIDIVKIFNSQRNTKKCIVQNTTVNVHKQCICLLKNNVSSVVLPSTSWNNPQIIKAFSEGEFIGYYKSGDTITFSGNSNGNFLIIYTLNDFGPIVPRGDVADAWFDVTGATLKTSFYSTGIKLKQYFSNGYYQFNALSSYPFQSSLNYENGTLYIQDGIKVFSGQNYFKGNSIDSVRIPLSLEKFQNEAFNDTTIRNFILYMGDECDWGDIERGNGSSPVPSSSANAYFNGDSTTPINSLNFHRVCKVNSSAFYYWTNFIYRIDNMKNITYIGNEAFYSCSNMNGNIEFSNSLSYIGNAAFMYCRNLGICQELVTIPNSVEYIGNDAFYGTKMKRIEFGKGVKTLGYRCFKQCSNLNTSVIFLPSSITSLNTSELFNEIGDVKLVINCNVSSIDSYSIASSVSYLDLCKHVTSISHGIFFSQNSKVILRGEYPPQNFENSSNLSSCSLYVNNENVQNFSNLQVFELIPFIECYEYTDSSAYGAKRFLFNSSEKKLYELINGTYTEISPQNNQHIYINTEHMDDIENGNKLWCFSTTNGWECITNNYIQ